MCFHIFLSTEYIFCRRNRCVRWSRDKSDAKQQWTSLQAFATRAEDEHRRHLVRDYSHLAVPCRRRWISIMETPLHHWECSVRVRR